jgi:hypothetical protein
VSESRSSGSRLRACRKCASSSGLFSMCEKASIRSKMPAVSRERPRRRERAVSTMSEGRNYYRRGIERSPDPGRRIELECTLASRDNGPEAVGTQPCRATRIHERQGSRP